MYHAFRRSSLRIFLRTTGLIAALVSPSLPAQTINAIGNNNVRIVGSSTVVRDSSEALQIGWNEEWWKTQQYWFNTSTMTMDSAVLAYQLNNQAGARYRFPGGTNSNYLDWSQTIGPVANRTIQWAVEGNSEVQKFPYFGFDEFMKFVADVEGEAVLVLNMQYNHVPDPLTPAEVTQWAQKAADWVEYCNAPNDGSNPGGGTDWAAVRAANGHAAPYNIKLWELGNELDWGGDSLTASAYASRCQTFMTAMLAIDPTIKFIAHARTSLEQQAGWQTWHQTVIDTLGNSIAYVTGHPYYDGLNVAIKIGSLDTIRSYSVANVATNPPQVIASEHGTWTNEGGNYDRNSGIYGAIATGDFLMAAANRPGIAHAWEHTLDGYGRWLAFYNNTGVWKERPISQAETIMQSVIHDNEVLGTTIYTPNNSAYGGGYDVRAVVTRDHATGNYVVGFINRWTGGAFTNAKIEIQGLPAGTYNCTKVYLSDPSQNSDTATNYLTVQTTSSNISATSSGGYGLLTISLPARSVGKIIIPNPNPPPAVSLTSPTANQSFTLGNAIPLTATATDANGVALVEFYHSGTGFISDDANTPYNGSWTPSAAGSYTLTAKAYDLGTPSASATSSGVPITVVAGGGSTTDPFPSIAAEDGWVLESTETSNVGGSLNATNTYSDALRIGDDGSKKQFKVLVSFDTSALPDGATVTAATLKLTRGIASYNPSAFIPLNVDIRTGAFNGNNALENADFQAAATATAVATMNYPTADGDVSTGTLNATGRAAINKTGRTQFRIAFNTDDDNDAFADYLGFWSAEATNAAHRPVLEVTYTTTNSVPSITTTSLPGGTTGTAYNQTLAATGGDGGLTWSLASGALPAGLSLSSGGVISGTPTTAGTANFTVRVADSDGVTGTSDEDTQALSIVVASGSTTDSFPFVAGEDGWVLESSETSGVGGSINATNTYSDALRIGDDGDRKQFKVILSFNTAGLPDGATITAATLKFTRGIASYNPSGFGTLHVDIRTGGFNGNTALENADFQAAATAAQVATMSYPAADGNVSTGTLNATGRAAINKTGTTQFRIYFNTEDDNDSLADYLGFWSGEAATTTNRPVLEITYQ